MLLRLPLQAELACQQQGSGSSQDEFLKKRGSHDDFRHSQQKQPEGMVLPSLLLPDICFLLTAFSLVTQSQILLPGCHALPLPGFLPGAMRL